MTQSVRPAAAVLKQLEELADLGQQGVLQVQKPLNAKAAETLPSLEAARGVAENVRCQRGQCSVSVKVGCAPRRGCSRMSLPNGTPCGLMGPQDVSKGGAPPAIICHNRRRLDQLVELE